MHFFCISVNLGDLQPVTCVDMAASAGKMANVGEYLVVFGLCVIALSADQPHLSHVGYLLLSRILSHRFTPELTFRSFPCGVY